MHDNAVKLCILLWESVGIDLVLELASSDHSRNCNFLALLRWPQRLPPGKYLILRKREMSRCVLKYILPQSVFLYPRGDKRTQQASTLTARLSLRPFIEAKQTATNRRQSRQASVLHWAWSFSGLPKTVRNLNISTAVLMLLESLFYMIIAIGHWTPPGLPFVTNSVHSFYA